MKTWQMIKELTENPDKKFRRVGEDRELYVGVHNNFVAWEGDYVLETGGEPFEIYTDLKKGSDNLIISRKWHMPNKHTFYIKPIKELIEKYLIDGIVIDPFKKIEQWAIAYKNIVLQVLELQPRCLVEV